MTARTGFPADCLGLNRLDVGLNLVREPLLHEASENALPLAVIELAVAESAAAVHDLIPADLDESDRLGLSRLEAHGCTSGDVKMLAVGEVAIEEEGFVRLEEGIVWA